MDDSSAAIDFDPTSPALVAGERLGLWRLLQVLGDSPSGVWWRAQHLRSGHAAHLLAYHRAADAGAVLLRMAQSEGQPWTHPDVAWPLDSGLLPDGRPYVVMPALDGEPLTRVLPEASLRQRLQWGLQLCELLLLAQAKGLSLVELDPSLLWVGSQRQLRLHALALVRLDAGALRMGSLEGQLCVAAQALQCPASARGKPGSATGLVFSVGTLLCWLVNGRLPDGGEPTGAVLTSLSQWLTLPSAARAELDALLHQAVDVDPARRPPDLEQLALAIESWLERSGALAATAAGALTPAEPEALPITSPVERAAPRMPVARPPAAEPAEPDASSNERVPRWTLGLLLLILVLVALAVLTGQRATP